MVPNKEGGVWGHGPLGKFKVKFLESQEQSLEIITELNCTTVEAENINGPFGLSENM